MNINPLVKELLHKRGIDSPEEIEEFLSTKPKKTYDPFLLPDMEAGVDLILSEIKKGSSICIYGDYDADGTTSCTLMLGVLSKLTDSKRLGYYIPSRFEEGYGLNMEAVKTIRGRGFDMIVTVDCGSVSYREVEYAKELGMKIVVTDHHSITDNMADCLLINPKKPGSPYPFKDLSGCGVAFKVAQAIQKKAELPKSVLTEALDLAAIGTIGDIMPLLDENRTIVKFGIKVIREGKRKGLLRLEEAASLEPARITSENISYIIVPHLNASGRIQDASQVVELLRGECDDSRLSEIASDMAQKNILRKKLQQETFEACRVYAEEEGSENFILINSPDAHEGIAGIVAGKIKDAYYRPTVIVTPSGENGEYLKGTGRSIEGINLYLLLKTQERLFEKFGGHAGACGFLMKKENFGAFREGLLAEAERIREASPDVFVRKYMPDIIADTEDVTEELAEQIELLAPFGNKNPKPLIMLRNVLISDVRYMGNQFQHARFSVRSGQGGKKLTCVLFGRAQEFELSEGTEISTIFGTLSLQIWQGRKYLQLVVEEIKFDENPGQ